MGLHANSYGKDPKPPPIVIPLAVEEVDYTALYSATPALIKKYYPDRSVYYV